MAWRRAAAHFYLKSAFLNSIINKISCKFKYCTEWSFFIEFKLFKQVGICTICPNYSPWIFFPKRFEVIWRVTSWFWQVSGWHSPIVKIWTNNSNNPQKAKILLRYPINDYNRNKIEYSFSRSWNILDGIIPKYLVLIIFLYPHIIY